jgi:hypothetical protein
MHVRVQLENGYTDFHQTWYAQSLTPEGEYRNVEIRGKVCWIRVSVKTVNVARKLSTIEKRQDQSYVLRQRDYRKEGHNLEKVSWVLASVTVVSLARQLSWIEAGNMTPSIAK